MKKSIVKIICMVLVVAVLFTGCGGKIPNVKVEEITVAGVSLPLKGEILDPFYNENDTHFFFSTTKKVSNISEFYNMVEEMVSEVDGLTFEPIPYLGNDYAMFIKENGDGTTSYSTMETHAVSMNTLSLIFDEPKTLMKIAESNGDKQFEFADILFPQYILTSFIEREYLVLGVDEKVHKETTLDEIYDFYNESGQIDVEKVDDGIIFHSELADIMEDGKLKLTFRTHLGENLIKFDLIEDEI